MARDRTRLSDDEPGRLDRLRLHRRRIDAVVPDQRIGHHENLTAVRRVREGFRVPRHVRVEDELAEDLAVRPKKRSLDGRSVLEDEGATHPLDPHPIFDSPYERFSLDLISWVRVRYGMRGKSRWFSRSTILSQ